MSRARHIGTQRRCTDCEGCGVVEVATTAFPSPDDYEARMCEPCLGTGWIDWRQDKCGADPLVLLKDARRVLTRSHWRGSDFAQRRYREARAAAMQRARLPSPAINAWRKAA